MVKLLRQLAGETAVYGLSSILGRLLHFVILTPYLTRVLAPVEYGVYSDLYFWAAFLLVLLTYRMETTFFRFGREKEDRPVVFATGSLFVLALTLLFVGLAIGNAPRVATWLQYPEYPQFVVWFALIIGFDALAALPLAQLRLESRPMRFALIRISGILLNIGAIFFFLEFWPQWSGVEPGGLEKLSWLFISNLLASGAVLLLLLPAYLRVRLQVDWRRLKKMLLYAGPLVVAAGAGITNQLIGTPLIKWLASDDLAFNLRQAGLYSSAAKLAVFMNLFTQAFNYAAEPFFFRQSVEEHSRELYAQVAQAFALVGSLAFLGILLYLPVLQYFLGEEFREGLGILPLLLMANLFLGLYYNFSIWFKLQDRTRIGGYIALGGSAIVLLLNWLLIPRIGYYGPAWATLACYGFMAGIGYWTGRQYYPIPYPIGRILLYPGLGVGVYLLSLWTDQFLPEQIWARIGIHTLWFLCFFGLVAGSERKNLRKWLLRASPSKKDLP